ncbi:MAG: triose-phosphate isomerase [Acidobacteriota bacterium]
MRTPVVAGNWKMYKSAHEAQAFMNELTPMLGETRHCEVVVCPPYPALPAAISAARGSIIEIGAQDVFWVKEGAYTGEVSAPMLTAIGCKWVIIGHSERRRFFGDTDETVRLKIVAALDAGLNPIVCLGEKLDEREAGEAENVLADQFVGAIAGLTPGQFARLTIAYEPIWAIGTGRTATPQTARDAHRFIRARAAYRFGEELAQFCRIIYGGSVKPENAAALLQQSEIDGALVGGASLDARSFASIVNLLSI